MQIFWHLKLVEKLVGTALLITTTSVFIRNLPDSGGTEEFAEQFVHEPQSLNDVKSKITVAHIRNAEICLAEA